MTDDGVSRKGRRAGRPTSRLLDRELIFRTALAIVDEDGEPALTLARIAQRLSVRTPSLYHYVSGREEIIEGLRGLLIDEGQMPEFGDRAWDEAVAHWCRRYRDALARHPNTIHLLATTPIRAEQSMQMYEGFIQGLGTVGWPESDLLDVVAVLESFILGSALDLAAPPVMYDAGDRATDFPHLARALAAHPSPDHRADRAFEIGLELLISGLRARYPER